MMKLRTYHIGLIEKSEELKPVFSRKALFKYEGDQVWIYNDSLLNFHERSEIKVLGL